jgi:hypothetical protein
MPYTRRQVLRAAGLVPIGLGAAAIATRLGEALRSATAGLRPPASGTTATRCALCGAGDHTMLDPRCPAAPRVI